MFGRIVGRRIRRGMKGSPFGAVMRGTKEATWGLLPVILTVFKVPFGMLGGSLAQRYVKPQTDRVFDFLWGSSGSSGGAPSSGSSSKRRKFGKSARRRGRRF